MLRYFFAFFLLFVGAGARLKAQPLPSNQPEQDACHALLLCGNSFYTPYTYQGNGLENDLLNTPCGVPGLNAGEDNVVWLKLNVSTSGTLLFNISPLNTQDDYDWAVLDVTNQDCHNLSSQNVVRCNFNRNTPVTSGGNTGLTMTATPTSVAAGTAGYNFCQYLNVQAGEVYLIMINNFGVGGGPTSGFTITFTGSTATFNNDGAPHFLNANQSCNTRQSVLVNLSKPVSCASIAANGSDFTLSPSGNILSATGINCNGSQGYTDQVQINFSPVLAPGNYTLHAQTGTDGNTLLDLCDNPLTIPDSVSFFVPDLDSAVTLTICASQLPFNWFGHILAGGGQNIAQHAFPNQTGCDSIVTLSLDVVDTLMAVVPLTICPNEMPYTWNGIVVSTPGPGAASFYAHSTNGCDSLTTLNLTVLQAYTQHYDLEGCGDVSFNGHTYLQSQQVNDTIVSSIGCDSVYASLSVVVHPVNPLTFTLDTAGCSSLLYQGTTYTESTVLHDTVFNQYGCDSIYHITHITIYPDFYEPHSYSLSECDSVVFEGRKYFDDIILTDTFQNVLGCDSAIRTVNIHPEHFTLELTADPEEPVQGVFLILATHANVPGYTITAWIPEEDFSNQFATEQHLLAKESTLYKAVGISALGCVDTAELNLKVDSLIPVAIMPNAFSPNGDGLNDVFEPNFVNKNGYKINTFRIYNRLGQIVFSKGGVENTGWNGNYMNADKPADKGVYYYYIDIEFVNGKKLFFKGDVTLIR
jgi:gliding motility-associated-like protein